MKHCAMLISFFLYVMQHKWFVFIECCKLGVPLLGIVHDMSKFSREEFFAYANARYGAYNLRSWSYAWLHHQHINKHHPEHYVLAWQGDKTYYDDIATKLSNEHNISVLPMPDRYCREYVADMRAMGRVFGNCALDFYLQRRDEIILHDTSRETIERLLGK